MEKYFRFPVGCFNTALGIPDEFKQTSFLVRGKSISVIYISMKIKISPFQALKNYIVSPFLSPLPDNQRGIEEKAIAGINLNPAADWRAAWEKNLQRQTLYNNIVKEVFNSFTRILGWHLISVVGSRLQYKKIPHSSFS